MKKIRRIIACAITALFPLMLLFSGGTAIDAYAVATTCETYNGSNIGYQNYIYNWARTIQSYLTKSASGGLMRVQGNAVNGKILVEYYDSSYNILSSKTVNAELPIFGAFYETTSNYFILSGQENRSESNSVEVYRITKYDKDWNRIGSCGLFGANTYIPFDAGSARMDHLGKYLLIRTCHEMYMSSDGLHHQANVTIQVDMDSMTITDSYTDVMNVNYGYVSHSFNQFIRLDGSQIVAVDHGDAHPRSIVLIKYATDYRTGKFSPGWGSECEAIDLVKFPGATGANVTGATVGGFEMSSSSYIVAGSYAGDAKNMASGAVKNIFVSTLGKNSSTPSMKWITNYTSGSVSTPHLVRLESDSFLLMWSYNGNVYYTRLDGSGNTSGSIYSMTAELSDCVPLLYNGRLLWYTWNNETVTFYSINASDLSSRSSTVIVNGHDFDTTNTPGSTKATQKCKKCGLTQTITVPSEFSVWWRENADSSYFWDSCSSEYVVGNTLDAWVRFSQTVDNSDMVYEISDNTIASLTPTTNPDINRITMNKSGTFTLKIYPKYNTSVKQTYTFTVQGQNQHQHNYTVRVTKSASCTETGLQNKTCTICNDRITETIPKLSHNYSTAWTTDKEATCSTEGSKSHHCLNCGDKKDVTAIPKTDHKFTSNITKAATCTEPGTEILTCSVCKTTQNKTISAKGHSFGAYKTIVQPTAEKEGIEERACSVCGKTEQRTVSKLSGSGNSSPSSLTIEKPDNSSSASDSGEDSSSTGNEDNSSLTETSSSVPEQDTSTDNKEDSSSASDSSSSSTPADSSSDDSDESISSDNDDPDEPPDNTGSQAPADSNSENNFKKSEFPFIPIVIASAAGVVAICIGIIIAVTPKKKK